MEIIKDFNNVKEIKWYDCVEVEYNSGDIEIYNVIDIRHRGRFLKSENSSPISELVIFEDKLLICYADGSRYLSSDTIKSITVDDKRMKRNSEDKKVGIEGTLLKYDVFTGLKYHLDLQKANGIPSEFEIQYYSEKYSDPIKTKRKTN